jgi:hypothetical protein
MRPGEEIYERGRDKRSPAASLYRVKTKKSATYIADFPVSSSKMSIAVSYTSSAYRIVNTIGRI